MNKISTFDCVVCFSFNAVSYKMEFNLPHEVLMFRCSSFPFSSGAWRRKSSKPAICIWN